MTKLSEQRQGDPERLLPIVARAFAELGYRRATTAQLARRCGVRENVLYRIWPSKKDMFLAAIDYVFGLARQTWEQAEADVPSPQEAAGRLLEYESTHHGELGLSRIVFAGLNESDDEDIRQGLCRMYRQFHQFIVGRLKAAQRPGKQQRGQEPCDVELIAWALVGLGTVSNIARELKMLSGPERTRLFRQVGQVLLEG